MVRAGETLYSIATRYGLDWRELARINDIGSDNLIRPGERLRLPKPDRASGASPKSASAAARPARRASPDDPAHRPPAWRWPVDVGTVAGTVKQPSGGVGLRIDGGLNQAILAAADGKVVYTGSGLLGYGQVVIINHVRGWLTAYGHNAFVHVKEGEEVRAGQRIAAMGLGPGQRPMLYFEIRLEGEPQDPLAQLPQR
ncbi:MAG TPA: peptidoglycan DD-metalloendopeptidase family protein [Steroidobacteraceae bacterium]|nr:peptidoglycan DD-metalloendopeptidase family protein [Steroidobacteraceae bacterium]